MVQLRNNFQGGTAGTTITTGNSGGASGNAFDVVSAPPAGGTLAPVSTPLMHAPLSMELQTAATAGLPSVSWTTSMGTKSQIWGRFYFYCPTGAYPAAKTRIVNFMSGATQCASITFGTTGLLTIRNAAGTDVTTGAVPIPLDVWVRIEFRYLFSTTVGSAQVDQYTSPPDGTTVAESITAAASQAFGAASVDTYLFGLPASSATRGPWRFADLALDDTAFPGPTPIAPELIMAQPRRVRT